MTIIYGSFMRRKEILTLLILSLLPLPALSAIGGNLTEELEPEIVGQINQTDILITPAEGSLWLQLRTAWQEQVFWKRLAIQAIIQDSEERDPVISRLMRNYADMAETLGPYFGNENANLYGDLIEEHLQLSADFALAAREDDQMALEGITNRLYENSDEIASFENNTIPRLSLVERRAMWHEYLNLSRNETTELLNGDYINSTDTLDRTLEQASMMADSLTNGIIQQFPERFH
jgi:hypothetical protein